MNAPDIGDEQQELRGKLRDVEAEIARLRGENDGLTGQLGGREYGAGDEQDTAAAVTNLEETQAILATLEQRRETLLRRLGED